MRVWSLFPLPSELEFYHEFQHITRTLLFTNKPYVFDRSTELLLRVFDLNLDRGAFANDIDHSDTAYRARRSQYKHAHSGQTDVGND